MLRRQAAGALLVLCAAGAAEAGPEFHRGICYAHLWRLLGKDGYGTARSAQTVARLVKLGVNWVSLTPFGYMSSPDSDEIRTSQGGGGESDARLSRELAHDRAAGIKVALKPHLWIHRGAWQGELAWRDEAHFRRWFASYRGFILRYAELAERERFDLLVVGTELKTATARDPAAWRALIAEVRRVYHGPLTYAANWDEAEHVAFWDALDYVGVQAYAPIAGKPGASLDELRAGWRKIADGLGRLSKRAGRPILLTELGYRATRDAALSPATWPESDKNPHYDPAHQADCYRAAFETLWGQPWLAGIYIWKWFTDSLDEQGPTDFSPAGKPAEEVLRQFYRRP